MSTLPEQLYWLDRASGRARGPFSVAQFREFAETGALLPGHEVAAPGAPNWVTLQDWPELQAALFPAHPGPQLSHEHYQAQQEAPPELESDPYAILAINRAREDPDELILTDEDLRPKLSRRVKDFWVMLVGGNVAILLLAGAIGLIGGLNAVALTYVLAFMVTWSVGITWLSFGVMSRF